MISDSAGGIVDGLGCRECESDDGRIKRKGGAEGREGERERL
jgi:hypothetical protein